MFLTCARRLLLTLSALPHSPQLVDPATVELALRFSRESGNARFRVGYNSLGAYATINHLHFQVWNYLGWSGAYAMINHLHFQVWN